jgi:hypothetical protein
MAKTFSPAFHLFHSWVGWRVPAYATLTAYATQEHGLFLPEDKKKANAILHDRKMVMARPFEIAQYLGQGFPLDINDPNDAIKVYGWIMEHMANWLAYASNPSLIMRTIPMEGMREFNTLANKLFPVAHRFGYFEKPKVTMSDSLQVFFGGEVKATQQKHRFNDTLIRRLEVAARYQTRGQR